MGSAPASEVAATTPRHPCAAAAQLPSSCRDTSSREHQVYAKPSSASCSTTSPSLSYSAGRAGQAGQAGQAVGWVGPAPRWGPPPAAPFSCPAPAECTECWYPNRSMFTKRSPQGPTALMDHPPTHLPACCRSVRRCGTTACPQQRPPAPRCGGAGAARCARCPPAGCWAPFPCINTTEGRGQSGWEVVKLSEQHVGELHATCILGTAVIQWLLPRRPAVSPGANPIPILSRATNAPELQQLPAPLVTRVTCHRHLHPLART